MRHRIRENWVIVRAGNARLLERKTSRLPVSGSLNLIRRDGDCARQISPIIDGLPAL
jgi:hypothetical protein